MYDSLTRRLVRSTSMARGGATLTRGTEDCRQPAGETISQTRRTVDEAAPELVDGMRDGSIVDRSRRPYKPAGPVLRAGAADALLPVFGSRRLAEVKAGDCSASLRPCFATA